MNYIRIANTNMTRGAQFFIIAGLCVVTVKSTAAAASIPELIRQRMSETASRSVQATSTESIISQDPELVLAELRQYESSPDARVRADCCSIEWSLGRKSSDEKIRQEVVTRLVNACEDKDGLVFQHAPVYLSCFAPEDFTEPAKRVIRKLVADTDHPYGRFILLCGVAGMKDQIPILQKIIKNDPNKDKLGTPAWRAHMALAIMGCKEDIAFCIKTVEAEPNVFLRLTKYMNNLAFIRQPEVIPFLTSCLENNARIPAEYGGLRTPYWEFALKALALVIEDFPVKYSAYYWVRPGEELENARDWMRSQENFKFNRALVDSPDL